MNRQNLVNKIWLCRSNSAFTQGWLLAFQCLKPMLIYYNNAKLVRILWVSPFSLSLFTYCVSDLGVHLLFLLPLFIITVLVWAVFLCLYAIFCHLNTSLFFVYLNLIFHHILFSFFFSVIGFWLIFLFFSTSLFFFFLHPPPPPPPTLSSFHHYCSIQSCYYRFLCSLLACRLAGTDCKNRQLPKIVILM